ncbi:MAG: magnesium transporter [Oscillospiraceae bacterium]|nr:magnesium transporter [Oscillospiraceae bacterium]
MNLEDFVETYGFSVDDLNQLLEEKKFRQFKEKLNDLNEADAAEYIEELPENQRLLVYRMLNKSTAADVFAFLPVETQGIIINGITDVEVSRIIEDLYVDDAVDMLEELPAMVVRRVLTNAKPETRKLINQFLKYPDNSAGSVMTAEYLALRKEWEVHDAYDYIRANGQDSETIYVLFVIDQERHLEGVVTVKDLLMHPYEARIADIMDDNVIRCVTTDDQEDAAELINRYDLLSLAVVDQENRLVGIITVDDAIDVLEEEATEDIEKMAAIVPTDKPYFKTGIWETWKSRIPWLLLLMVSATFTGQIITNFEDSLSAFVALTAFIPMLMDTGGNSGSQASVTVIRALSLGDIEFRDLGRVIWKEIRVAVICGITLAAVNFLKIILVDGLLFHNEGINMYVAAVVCLTLAVTIVCAKLVGCTLPMLADKLGLDPAVMASPFITTIVDAFSLLIYFQFAKILLGV